jgi:LPS-assembly protein
MSDKSLKYKNSPQSELMSSYFFDASLPLKKITKDKKNTLIPKLNLRISPHDMKYHSNTSRRINIENVFSAGRLGLGDSFETGESLTVGIDFKKEKINQVNKIVEIEEYFDFKLATVFRFNKEKDIPINSTLNEKTSNIFGLVGFKPTKDILLNYDFSLTNDLNIIEHQTIGASYLTENFSTSFGFT